MTGLSRRSGRVQTTWLFFLGSVVLFAGLFVLLAVDPTRWFDAKRSTRSLVVYCAAGMKPPVEAAARRYEQEFGVQIEFDYGGSNALLAKLQVNRHADLFIPADDGYVATAREQELIREVLPLARMRPVLVVRTGNPKSIHSLDDLLSRNLRVAQANPQTAAVGKVAREALERLGKWSALESRIVVTKPTVTDVAIDVQLGAVDAGIIWDVTVHQVPGLEVIAVPEFESVFARVSACIVNKDEPATPALHFARYLAAGDRGLQEFRKEGFDVVEGDRWADQPNLVLIAGSMLRPAVEETIQEFEHREGVTVTRDYNGCGIQVAKIRIPNTRVDAFFACDREFMDQVSELFGDATTVSTNQLVILVHKGNPHKIRKLRDLGKPNLRVGIGHEKQCAMGVLTQRTLREDRSDDVVMKNVKVQTPTGDMLVNQLVTGSLDAVIAYISNGATHADRLEAIAIDIPCAFADQPFAVSRSSEYPYLTARLLEAIRSRESRARFEAYGFTWRGTAAK